HVSRRYRQDRIVGLIGDIPMLHDVVDIAVTNGECSGQGRVIHEGEGFANCRDKTILEHGKEESVWVYVSISKYIQNAELAAVRPCNVDQQSATAHLRVAADR